MNKISFTSIAWDEYLYWQSQDRKTLKKINELLKDISRNNEGIGKPEPLKYRPGCWSRRIDKKNRLVYMTDSENNIYVLSCKGHYED